MAPTVAFEVVFEALTSVCIIFSLLPEQLHFMNPCPPPNEPIETASLIDSILD